MSRSKKQTTAQPLLLTIPDVAVKLGVCRKTVYNLMYHNGLPYVEVGRIRRVLSTSLDKWLSQCERQSA
jgi:excisionase family DNA binding protein